MSERDLIPGSFETLKSGEAMQNGMMPVAMMQNFESFVAQCKAEYGSISSRHESE